MDESPTSNLTLHDREREELDRVANGLVLHDEASVRQRKRLSDAGLIVYAGWSVTPAGEDVLNGE